MGTEVLDVLDLTAFGEDLEHVGMDDFELLGLGGQFSLHFLRSDEKVLQERPGFLHFDQSLHHVVNSAQILFPLFDLLLEVPHIFRQ